ncbi:dienelactone hydrolase [Xylaria bambusicola]|uniref:dienelactone hydrolase n=1 Tax=Xylaria bambusicola TaxID=326684 RepID=UPI0020075C92|nr:dienelactone hydrolase [Xylaria bambusicola]KAI0505744.1 dienelactone hydrolase [Xylaria bambusicola]
MASNPPGKCCTVGVKHDGEPTGADIKVGKHDAYLATPDPAKAHKDTAILYLPDVIGLWQNSKLIADQFAANGYLTLIIDLFNGDPVSLNPPAGFEIFKWLENGSDGKNPHTKEHVDPIVVEAIKWLQTEKGIKKLGSVGYCFGAKYVARHFDKGINVGYMAHPSFVDEDELRGFKGPLSIAAAETDQIFPAEKRHRSEEILKEVGQPYQINLYSGVVHGFAVRSDITKKDEKFAKEQAFLQAVQWFDYFLL